MVKCLVLAQWTRTEGYKLVYCSLTILYLTFYTKTFDFIEPKVFKKTNSYKKNKQPQNIP